MKFAAIIVRARSVQTGSGPDLDGMKRYVDETVRFVQHEMENPNNDPDYVVRAFIYKAGLPKAVAALGFSELDGKPEWFEPNF